jgi:hypothetical protein
MEHDVRLYLYRSLVSQPRELDEAARMLRLTTWQRF